MCWMTAVLIFNSDPLQSFYSHYKLQQALSTMNKPTIKGEWLVSELPALSIM